MKNIEQKEAIETENLWGDHVEKFLDCTTRGYHLLLNHARKIEIERNEAREREAKMAGELHELQSEVGHFLYAGERYSDEKRLSAAYDRAVKALDDRDKEFAP